MIFSDFLPRLRHDTNDPHEIIPLSFNLQDIIQNKYYKIHESE